MSLFPDAPERTLVGASEWIPGGEKFEVAEEQFELAGFQIYAVEKWYAVITPCTVSCLVIYLHKG